jgi:hypothetical protein
LNPSLRFFQSFSLKVLGVSKSLVLGEAKFCVKSEGLRRKRRRRRRRRRRQVFPMNNFSTPFTFRIGKAGL